MESTGGSPGGNNPRVLAGGMYMSLIIGPALAAGDASLKMLAFAIAGVIAIVSLFFLSRG